MSESINGHNEGSILPNKIQNSSIGDEIKVTNGTTEGKICRDFLRKVCHRGSRCKFIHTNDDTLEKEISHKKRELTFCHDFQNGFCLRSSCRFMHCTVGEEEYYLKTGHILPHILVQATIKGQILDYANGEVPICKDFLMGDCLRKRGGKCRFRHLTKTEFEYEVYGRNEMQSNCDPNSNQTMPEAKRQRYENSSTDFFRDQRDREFIRPMEDRMDMMPRELSLREFRDRDRELDRERDRRGLEEVLLLRKQLETLKKEIASLKKENSDLRATNDFLLEKVTTLGMNKAGGTVTTVTVPAVSLASTIPVATSVRPLTAAQVSHPLSITSECSVGSVGSVVAMHPPQAARAQPQALAPATQQVVEVAAPTAVLGSVGGVQVSLSQAPALTAVSLNPPIVPETSMSASIAPSIAPPPGTAASIGQAMSMSGGSAHLVSYPIMTQPGLRPQIQ